MNEPIMPPAPIAVPVRGDLRPLWIGAVATVFGVLAGSAATYFMLHMSIRYDFRVMSERRGTVTFESLYRVDRFSGETTVARDPIGEMKRREAEASSFSTKATEYGELSLKVSALRVEHDRLADGIGRQHETMRELKQELDKIVDDVARMFPNDPETQKWVRIARAKTAAP